MTTIQPNPELIPTQETELLPEFTLELNGHELVDPATNRGEVVGTKQVDSITDAEGNVICEAHDIYVKDPYVDADPMGYQLVSDYIAKMEERLIRDGFNPLIGDRQEAMSREERNPYTRAWTHGPSAAGVSMWRDLVPTAEALDYLTNPYPDVPIQNREGDITVVSPETAIQLRFTDDGIGIRDRAVAMQVIAEEHLAHLNETSNDVRWLSLASGTAEPAIAASKAAEEYAAANGKDLDIKLTVADYDRASLNRVRGHAERYGIAEENITDVEMNILTPKLREKLAKKSGSDELYDVVENLGFEEYLPQAGDELEAKKGNGLPQASEFTRQAFDLVKPGGVLISGNMVLPRPQVNFVFGIVDWPIINARTEESILRVYKEAGIIDDPNAKVEMFRVKNAQTGGHVYNIVKVTKLPA